MTLLTAIMASAARVRALAPAGLFRFLSIGIAGLATHTGVFNVLYRAGLAQSPAWFVGLTVATLVTWGLNRRLTFARTGRRMRAEAIRYVLVTVVAQGISYAVFKSLGGVAPQVPPTIDLLIGAVIATIFSYSGHRLLTFAPHKPQGSSSAREVPVA